MSEMLGTHASDQHALSCLSIFKQVLIADVDVPAVFAREVCCPVVQGVYKSPSLAGKITTITELLLGRH